ncbi:helix-turn-helix domain-containing protein [Glaciimonas soli]|uniref:Helix-turn-helix domain-containing protein n=1 Tax=Glaciimonas soli TaxID=2590999 RepID=A0A843YSH3_9BURK|nr:helix-turn-helix transcriptional regulator [Glaciimonas soli]MQR00664.1 helix-turn-helix domain-containing protein [Glaciimonas soli]
MQRPSSKRDDSKELEALGLAIRAVRKEQGLSQEALADQAGIDRSHMGRIERGERNVTILNVLRVSNALSFKLSELFKRAEL